MNENTNVKPAYVSPLKHICMTIGELPSSYIETMSYYEMLVWFCEYLRNTIIPTVNNNASAVQELQHLYEELQEYVNNYFDNLDVQEEINNKLEEMAESGELGDILSTYVTPIINNLEREVNEELSTLNTKVDNNYESLNSILGEIITSGVAPIPVSSTSQMTDTSKIYVNTTNGEWYYYNGTAWTSGGTYQSSEDSTDLMIASDTGKGLGLIFTKKGLFPFTSLQYGYINNTTGVITSNNSRLYTDSYIEDKIQRLIIDSGYSVCVYCYDNTDTYVGRITTTYEVSSAEGVTNKWFTDLDFNFIRGKFPNYKFKLVFRKDDYSSISNVGSFLAHFNTYVKNELEEYTFNQNTKYQYNDNSIWAIGEIDGQTGNILTTNSRFYTTSYIPDYVSELIGLNGRVFKIHAYNSSNVYIGRVQDNNRISTTTGTTKLDSYINLDELRRLYPNFKFKATMINGTSTAQQQLHQARNGIFVTSRKIQNTITSRKHYGYDVVSLPNTANHDMTYVGDYIYLFDAPSQQYAGKFNILNSDLTINRTKYTNFNYLLRDGTTTSYLRMKSVDYNPSNHILAIANGQAPVLTGDSYLFLFYNSEDWRSSDNLTINFSNCGEYKKIDLSVLGDKVYCFWKTYKDTNEMYVTINNLEKIYLIELGKGTNNLGLGTYESTTSDKYNGSFRIVECFKQLNNNIPSINAHGGQVYNGELYLASNNEYECVIYKAILGDDSSLNFEKLDINEYENGILKYSYFDGMLIKDGEIIADPLKVNEVYNTGSNKVLIKINIKD